MTFPKIEDTPERQSDEFKAQQAVAKLADEWTEEEREAFWADFDCRR